METLDANGAVVGVFEEWFGDSAVKALGGPRYFACLQYGGDRGAERRRRGRAARRGGRPRRTRGARAAGGAGVRTEVQQVGGTVQSDYLTLLVGRDTVASEPVGDGQRLSGWLVSPVTCTRLQRRKRNGSWRLTSKPSGGQRFELHQETSGRRTAIAGATEEVVVMRALGQRPESPLPTTVARR